MLYDFLLGVTLVVLTRWQDLNLLGQQYANELSQISLINHTIAHFNYSK